MKNILQNKNTPYVLGLICAVAFFAAHIYFNIAVPKVNLWSYEALCEIGFLLMLLSLVPFMCERILRANGQRRGAGFTVLLIAQCLLCSFRRAYRHRTRNPKPQHYNAHRSYCRRADVPYAAAAAPMRAYLVQRGGNSRRMGAARLRSGCGCAAPPYSFA